MTATTAGPSRRARGGLDRVKTRLLRRLWREARPVPDSPKAYRPCASLPRAGVRQEFGGHPSPSCWRNLTLRALVLEQRWNKRSPNAMSDFRARGLAALKAKIAAIETGAR